MATADKKSLFVNGGNGGPISPTGNPVTDLERAQDVARRYRCEFVDLSGFELHHELFKKIPVELMFRYNFVPLEETADGKLAIAIADPSLAHLAIQPLRLAFQRRQALFSLRGMIPCIAGQRQQLHGVAAIALQ